VNGRDHLRIVSDAERAVSAHHQEQQQVIAHLRELTVQMRDLRKHYESLIRAAARLKVANTDLARAMGKSEAAVRMYKKRRGIT
jgi:regulator of replication initiation timing